MWNSRMQRQRLVIPGTVDPERDAFRNTTLSPLWILHRKAGPDNRFYMIKNGTVVKGMTI